jgi:hypothetical protein
MCRVDVSVELCESRQSQNSSLSETFVHCEMVAVGDADDRTAADEIDRVCRRPGRARRVPAVPDLTLITFLAFPRARS